MRMMFCVALLSAVAATGRAQAPSDAPVLCSHQGIVWGYSAIPVNGESRMRDVKLRFGDGTQIHADEMLVEKSAPGGWAVLELRGHVRLIVPGCE